MRINGRRGAFQILFATVYLIIGASYVIVPSTASRRAALDWLTEVIPLDVIGWLWIIGALIAVTGAFLPRPKDWYAYAVLTFVPAVWGAFYLISWMVGDSRTGWLTSALYWVIAGAVMVVSGMQGTKDRDERECAL